MERVKMTMSSFEGQMGQHAARGPHLVSGYFAPPRAVMLSLNGHPDRR